MAHLLLPAVRKLSLVRLRGVAGDAEDVAALPVLLIFSCQLFKNEPGEAEGVAGDAKDVRERRDNDHDDSDEMMMITIIIASALPAMMTCAMTITIITASLAVPS